MRRTIITILIAIAATLLTGCTGKANSFFSAKLEVDILKKPRVAIGQKAIEVDAEVQKEIVATEAATEITAAAMEKKVITDAESLSNTYVKIFGAHK